MLLQTYQGLDAKSPAYDEQVDRILRQLIQLNSDQAVPLCAKHIDNPNSDTGFTFIIAENSNVYMRYLLRRGTGSLHEMLNQAKQPDLAPHKRETYIWYAGVLLSHLHGAKREQILKCRDLLALTYDKDLLDPVTAKALATPFPCR